MYKCEFWTEFVDVDKFQQNLPSYAYTGSFIFSESAAESVRITKVSRNQEVVFHVSFSSKRYPEIMGFMAGVGGAIRDTAISEAIEIKD